MYMYLFQHLFVLKTLGGLFRFLSSISLVHLIPFMIPLRYLRIRGRRYTDSTANYLARSISVLVLSCNPVSILHSDPHGFDQTIDARWLKKVQSLITCLVHNIIL
jgi:hypothetical protein